MIMATSLVLDFGEDTTKDWRVVNDGVMGGLSQGTVSYVDDIMHFEGTLSLENNGGFSSIRGPLKNYDLSSFEKVTIRFRGNGGTFGLRLKTDEPYYMPYFKMNFLPTDEWQTMTFDLRDFPQWRLNDLTGSKADTESLSKIIRLGIIKSDKKVGPFELDVDYIKFE